MLTSCLVGEMLFHTHRTILPDKTSPSIFAHPRQTSVYYQ